MKKPSLPESCYKVYQYTHGGHLKDIPLPHIRKFPNPYIKRQVRISFGIFWGIGTHYYIHIYMDANPLWDSKQQTWVTPWDDPLTLEEEYDKIGISYYDRNYKDSAFPIIRGKALVMAKKFDSRYFEVEVDEE